MDGFGYRFLVAKSRFPVGSAIFHCHLIGQLAAKYIFAEGDGFDILRCGNFVMQRCLGKRALMSLKEK